MSVSICTSCLSRLGISHHATTRSPISSLSPFIASFHASTPSQNVLKKKQGALAANKFRVASAARIKRKQRERPRPPAPGERKAQRNRIVLSNTNALEIPGLEYLTRENASDSELSGRMLAIQGPALDQLRDLRAFKTTQNWSLFRQPSTLVRAETVDLGKDIADVTASREDQGFGTRTIQKIVTGEQGSGKSVYLLQAMNMAFLNDWVVLHIPECQDYTINQSAYAPETTSEERAEQRYDQSSLTADVLGRLASANATVLSKLKLNHTHDKSIRIQKHATLKDLAQIGAEEPSMAMPIFSALWKELTVEPKDTTHKQPRPPLLVTIDGLDHWMGPTMYRSSDYQVIHAHQFTLIRHFLDLLFSQQPNSLPYGGMILAATTRSNTTNFPSFNLLLEQISALQNQGLQPTDAQFPMPDAYAKADQRVLDLLKKANNTDVLHLKGLSKPESKSLLEYFARSGVLRERITDAFIGSTFSLTANGLIGELCKFGARIRV